MSDYVTLVHPNLPGQPIRVKRRLIAPRLGAGWEIQEPPESGSPAVQTQSEETKPRRRRATKPEDE